MPSPIAQSLEPLSEEEFDQLAEWLEACSPFDSDGLLGILHAVAVAPSLLAPSAWLGVVLPSGFGELRANDIEQLIGLLVRLHGQVVSAINDGQVRMPEADDIDRCEAFARGYAAGAELDPEWLGKEDRWSFASAVAYLGGRLDLVSKTTVEQIEINLAPDPKHILRRDLGGIVLAAAESFKKARLMLLSQSGARRPGPTKAAPAGRNDPCPCGSGAKYKRCCMRRNLELAPR